MCTCPRQGTSPWIVLLLVCIMDPHVIPLAYFESHLSIIYLTCASYCRFDTSLGVILCIASKWPMWTSRPLCAQHLVVFASAAIMFALSMTTSRHLVKRNQFLSSCWLSNMIIIPHPMHVSTLCTTHAWYVYICSCMFFVFLSFLFACLYFDHGNS